MGWQTGLPGAIRKAKRFLLKRFGTADMKRMAIYGELLECDIGQVGAMGFDFDDLEQGAASALLWLNEEIALARAPYGNAVILLTIIALSGDLQTCAEGTECYRLSPFQKKDWPKFRPTAIDRMKEAARQSPVNAVGISLFNFGEVILKSMSENDRVYVRNSRD